MARDRGAPGSHGRLAQVLAAAKPGGLILCADTPELSFWLLNGMDITSKLICLVSNESVCSALAESHEDDIRLTIHCQHAIEFLGDVRDHRFDLMVFPEVDPALAELLTGSLAPGGLLAVFPGQGETAEAAACRETDLSRQGLFTSFAVDGAVVAARIPDVSLRKRRGGRKRRTPAGS